MLDYSVLTILFLTVSKHAWFLYLVLAIYISSKWSSASFVFDCSITILNFWTVLRTYSLKILAISSSPLISLSLLAEFIILRDFTLFKKRRFTVWQKHSLSVSEDMSSFAIISSYISDATVSNAKRFKLLEIGL